ncbi:hypothetical protein BKA59DRAFT_455450 [Fusarium tricinctum]|uniref:Uncharacterized protein n=1 Tax=Fusarium tricinctum TaxID=61284 RepID=A0A8K0RYU6_9HYPO|nr:hypothetical protein BKA59DRAFT_455450 [Fusarium tricinctum]
MRFFLAILFCVSLATASFLSHGGTGADPSYKSSTYYWECGKEATSMKKFDCERLLSVLGKTPKHGWEPIKKGESREWHWDTCSVTIKVGHDSFYLVMEGDEFYEVGHWGLKALCGPSNQRTMVRPGNESWTAWITERHWEPEHAF